MSDPFPLEVVDSSDLDDADWSEINKPKRAFEAEGDRALDKALDKLAKHDPICHLVVVRAFFPQMVAEEIKDQFAEAGMTVDDLCELFRKLEDPRETNKRFQLA